jgi:hypothetical protein
MLKAMLTISFCRRLLPDAREVVEMQLQFLDLLIAKENGAVPLDAAVRADLIDLMARVLVVIFQEEGRRVDDRRCLQFQDQAGAPGAQSDCLLAPVQREAGSPE